MTITNTYIENGIIEVEINGALVVEMNIDGTDAKVIPLTDDEPTEAEIKAAFEAAEAERVRVTA